jgi:hypothetical protein
MDGWPQTWITSRGIRPGLNPAGYMLPPPPPPPPPPSCMFPLFSRGIGRGWDLRLAGYPLSAPGERQYDEEHSEPSAPVHRFLRTARPSWPISEPRMSLDQARVIVFTSSTLSLRNTARHHQRKNTIDMYNKFSDLQGNCKTNPEEAGRELAGNVDHSRSETPPRPNARHFPDRWSACNRMG